MNYINQFSRRLLVAGFGRLAAGGLVPTTPAARLRRYGLVALLGATGLICLGVHAMPPDGNFDEFLEIKAKAERGDFRAEYHLGIAYQIGKGVAQDDVKAVRWFRKAAKQNYAPAQYNLGIHYGYGRGVAHDNVEGGKWCLKAAEQQYAPAELTQGYHYKFGILVAKNQAEAVAWFRKAADQNLALAQYELGFCYANGQGVAHDEVEADAWYDLAAQRNERAAKGRAALEKEMSPRQFADARRRADELRTQIANRRQRFLK